MRTPAHRALCNPAGFTLHELFVATAVSLLVCAMTVSFSRFQLFAYQNQAVQIDTQSTARDVLELFARDARRAGADPTCAKSFSGIASAGSGGLRVQSDLNGDGTISGANEDVTYQYDEATIALQRVSGGVTETLIQGLDLSGTGLRYFDSVGNEIPTTQDLTAAQRDSVRRIRLELKLRNADADPNTEAGVSVIAALATNADLRNRFFVSSTACP